MSRRVAIVVVAGALTTLLLALVLTSRGPAEPEPIEIPDETLAERSAAPRPEPDLARYDPEVGSESDPLAAGKTLLVSLESLRSIGTLVVPLRLGQPEIPGSTLEGRILTEGRVLELSAAVGDESTDVAQIEVASDFLTPGRYIVEIKTSERSHFPMRRYAIEVR